MKFFQNIWNWTRQDEEIDAKCYWKVDMHSHLIPGIDDGVKNMDESVQCIKSMKDLGFEKLIITPHISQDYFPNQEDEIISITNLVRKRLAEENIDIEIEAAGEYLIDEFFVNKLEERSLLYFGKEKYVLIEWGWANAPINFESIVFKMIVNGYKPVLAHPERYTYYQKDIEQIIALRQLGCTLQVNLMSLIGKYGDKPKVTAQKLLDKAQVDFIGSDVHRLNDIVTIKEKTRHDVLKQLKGQKFLNAELGS